MMHKAVAQTMIWSMQNLSLAELTINFSNTMGMSTAHKRQRHNFFLFLSICEFENFYPYY